MAYAGISLYIGRVFATTPYTNSYFVDIPALGRVTCTSGEEGSADRRGSTGGGASYLPGSLVVVAVSESGYEGSLGIAIPYIILCAFAQFPKPSETEHYPQCFVEHPADFNNSQVYDTITDEDSEKTLRQDRSFNRLLDALPGDWTKTNALGAILHVSMFLTRIGAGPDCMMQFHGIDRTAELTADIFIRDSASYLETIYKEGRYSLLVEQMAHTPFEGLGGKEEEVFEEDEEEGTIALKEADQRGLMRQTTLKGGAVEGELSYHQFPSKVDDDKKVHTYGGTVLAGMSRLMVRADGIVRIEGAKEVGLYKTGSIRVPQQAGDVNTLYPEGTEETEDEYDGQTDVEAKMEELGISTEAEYYAVKSLLGDTIKTFEEEKYFWRGLRQEGGIWTIPPKGTAYTEAAPAGDNPELQQISPTDPEYGFDTLSEIMTEAIEVAPGRKVKLFKNSSCFLMSEEGGITIGDGQGASLKMENGNLTLGSALDMKFQPGRNLLSIVPGNEIKKIGRSYEVSANGAGITFKSEGNLHMLSGNGGLGSTILENKATVNNLNEASQSLLESGFARGGGIILKSPSAPVAVMSNRFAVLGHSSEPGENDKGTERRYNPCEISLDAGPAAISMMGAIGSMLFDQQAVIGHSTSVNGIYIDAQTVMNISSGKVQLTAPIIAVEKGDGTVLRSELSSQGVRRARRISLPSLPPTMQLNARIQCAGVIEAKGDISTEGRFNANQGADAAPRSRSMYLTVSVDTPQTSRTKAMVKANADTINDILKSLVSNSIATDKAHTYASFCYPSSDSTIYNVDPAQMYLTEMPWQRLLRNNGNKWLENPVYNGILEDTYPYPGKQVFEEESKILKVLNEAGDGVEGKSFKDYITNA